MNVSLKKLSIRPFGVACICLIVGSLFVTSLRIVRVTSSSMEPTYCTGDLLVVINNLLFLTVRPNGAKVGDVCLFSSYKQVQGEFIKRVARISHEDGLTYYYILGDNNLKSLDSRDFGSIPANLARGLVLGRLGRKDCR
jgi:signal peptidase I